MSAPGHDEPTADGLAEAVEREHDADGSKREEPRTLDEDISPTDDSAAGQASSAPDGTTAG